MQSKSWPVWLVDCSCRLWIAFEHYTSKNVTCNDLSITLLVPCILCLMNGGARNLAFYKQWDQKTLWAVIEPSQEQTGLLTLNGSASPPLSIECQQRSLITPLIYRLWGWYVYGEMLMNPLLLCPVYHTSKSLQCSRNTTMTKAGFVSQLHF